MSQAMIVAVERLQQPHDLLADMAAAVDADGAAGEEQAVLDARPLAGAHREVERHHVAQPHQHEAERELRDRQPVGAPGVAELHAVALQRREIDGLAAGAVFADDLEIRQRRERALVDRLEADDGARRSPCRNAMVSSSSMRWPASLNCACG